MSTTTKPALGTSVGRKLIMAATGLFLVTFLIAHLSGNLLLLKPDDGAAFNEYAQFMASSPLVRIPEVIMFLGFLFHIYYAFTLTSQNNAARPIKYAKSEAPAGVTIFSRNMGLTGSIVLAFLLVHLGNFFFQHRIMGVTEPMFDTVRKAFQNPVYVGFYVLSMILLAFHLNHGFQSGLQTFGLGFSKELLKKYQLIGTILAVVICSGFALIPILMYIKYS
ncbi:MAG: succinate dehydrogenase cytochrome b subunit [Bacteroidia bacterium]|nr:succinate dehydrogenase cytochrome b subunit [Bacteroidia bacterium]